MVESPHAEKFAIEANAPSAGALLALVLAAVMVTGGYLGYVTVRHAEPIILPAPGGAYAVGRVILDWTDQTGTDPFAPPPATFRELSAWLWYPAPASATGKHAPVGSARTRAAGVAEQFAAQPA